MESHSGFRGRVDYHQEMMARIEKETVPDIESRLDSIAAALSEEERKIYENHYKELLFCARLDAVGVMCKHAKDFDRLEPDARAKAVLQMGAIRLLSAKWLLDQPQDFIIVRMQDLPPEALLSSAESAELLDKTGGIVVVSYGWLSNRHPDPFGWHLSTVRRYLEKHVKWNFRKNKVVTEEEPGLEDIGVFWDFASLPQDKGDIKRTHEEKICFDVGLGVVNLLYGNKRTIVIQLKHTKQKGTYDMAQLLTLTGGGTPNPTPYMERGWCFFEEVVSGVVKDSDRLLDLCYAEDQLDDPAATFRDVRYHANHDQAPPHSPDSMAAKLRTCTFTNGKSDMAIVESLYEVFFIESAKAATGRLFLANRGRGLGWNDEQIDTLVLALPYYSSISIVDLDGHQQVTEAALKVLHPVLLNMKQVQKVLLPSHLKDTAAADAFTEAWVASGRTEEVTKNTGISWSTHGKLVGPALP